MCRFYQCYALEKREDAVTDAVYLLTNALAEPKTSARDFKIGQWRKTIRTEPRMIGIAESDYAAIEAVLYQDHLDERAANTTLHNKFRRGIQVINVDLEACPI